MRSSDAAHRCAAMITKDFITAKDNSLIGPKILRDHVVVWWAADGPRDGRDVRD
jgi:hypothetical protein